MAGHIATSASTSWATPLRILEPVRAVFGGQIALDPASNPHSIVNAKTSFTLPVDGLSQKWDYPTIYVNPPFGKGIKNWVEKSLEASSDYGSEIILLTPAAVDTKYWQQLIFPYSDVICFIKGRVHFLKPDGSSGPSPMACAISYFGKQRDLFAENFEKIGRLV